MSQITTSKINILSKKSPSKTTLSQEKKSILEKMKTSREPPQIIDPFIGLKKLKVEPKKETEKDLEREKQRQEKLLALLIKDIMKG